MVRQWFFPFVLLAMLLGLVACGTDAPSEPGTAASSDTPQLSESYDGALSVMAQLALGTVQLEETGQAVDETQAAELLPLWQALQSLTRSGTAADVELNAVVNQIQATMRSEQIAAIAAMQLTDDSLAELQQGGGLADFRGGAGNGGGNGGRADGAPAGALPDAGGPPGGFGAGGGPPGGPPGGFAGGGQLDESTLATRQAQFASGDFQETAVMNMVIRLLAAKTGEELANPGRDMANLVYTTISEALGLSVAEIQAQETAGQSLAQIITANGGDVNAIHDSLVTALADLPQANNQDLDTFVTNWLQGSGPSGTPPAAAPTP